MPEYVFYHMQNEGCETADLPNAFGLAPSDSISSLKFGRFKDLFYRSVANDSRLVNGQLYFRFQLEDSKHDYLWLDITSDDDTCPVYHNTIAVKVLNISNSATANAKSRLQLKKESDNINATFLDYTSKPPRSDKKVTSSSSSSSSGVAGKKKDDGVIQENHSFFDYSSSSSSKSSNKNSSRISGLSDGDSKNLFDVNDYSAQSSGGGCGNAPSSGAFADVDEGDLKSSSQDIADDGLSNADYKARREQMIDEKVQAALEFKAAIDESQRKESDDMELARAKLDKGLTAWAMNNKEKRNIRTLLSTMHTGEPIFSTSAQTVSPLSYLRLHFYLFTPLSLLCHI